MKTITTPKHVRINLLALGLAAAAATAGPDVYEPIIPETPSGFSDARRTISNPTLFDLALPRTEVHAFYMFHRFPDMISVTGIPNMPEIELGGDAHIFAVQLEWALNERFSLVATKDGYIDFNPDGDAFGSTDGFANLAGGVKYAFIYNPEKRYVMSGTATVEFPTGNTDVFQGAGDGSANLILSQLKLWDKWQLAAAQGLQVPFDSDFATTGFLSGHLSYEICSWFIPLVELNWIHVFDEGDGGRRFTSQADGNVPAVATFEGADIINWGAANGEDNEYVTLALGFRSRLSENVDIGLAYEFPLTDEEDNITEDRFTFDLVWNF